jgi:predicted amidophosphoribosyltransferase
MGRLLEKYFEENLDFYQAFNVAPVPLHFNKIKERGFD